MDWDAAYDNVAAVGNAPDYVARWERAAADFVSSQGSLAQLGIGYGRSERERFDLFLPGSIPRGVLIFVHGGYWRRFNRDLWSWAAAGPLAHGWAVAFPGYTLCPEVRVATISRQIATAVGRIAQEVEGPIRLAGHSAGGHLVTRMLCPGMLAPEVADRIDRVISISGLHDLSPLRLTQMNETLKISEDEAREESPCNHQPAIRPALTCWVGGDELAEFRRQNRLLGHWRATGMEVTEIEAPGQNHMSVIDPLADPDSDLVNAIVG
ncbi:MAG: alpha/beta hydrolase [Pseudomonadota bacterium]